MRAVITVGTASGPLAASWRPARGSSRRPGRRWT